MALQPTISSNSNQTNWNTVNNAIQQLNNEQITKAFKQPGGNSVITGKLPNEDAYGTLYYDANNNLIIREGKLPYDGGYGTIYYDSNGIPVVIIGILPDGTTGIAISKPGISVIDAFS